MTLNKINDEPKCSEMPNLSNSTPTKFTKSVIGHQNRVRAWNILAAQRQPLFVQISSPDSLNVIPAELVSALALLIAIDTDALENFCSGFSLWIVNWGCRNFQIIFDRFGIPLTSLLLRYPQIEHLALIDLLGRTFSVDWSCVKGIWVLMLTHDFKQVWLVIILNLVTTLRMIPEKNKITNGDIQIFIP